MRRRGSAPSRSGARPPLAGRARLVVLLLVAGTGASSCTGLSVDQESPTHGTFRSTATSFTFLSLDYPAPALSIALGNAADTTLPDLVVRSERVVPRLGYLDWLLEILSVRYAVVSGTWGEPPPAE